MPLSGKLYILQQLTIARDMSHISGSKVMASAPGSCRFGWVKVIGRPTLAIASPTALGSINRRAWKRRSIARVWGLLLRPFAPNFAIFCSTRGGFIALTMGESNPTGRAEWFCLDDGSLNPKTKWNNVIDESFIFRLVLFPPWTQPNECFIVKRPFWIFMCPSGHTTWPFVS